MAVSDPAARRPSGPTGREGVTRRR
jgi:hypothetical protein